MTIDPDSLTRDQLAGHDPMWAALADVLDEWMWREHNVASSHHGVGLFLHLLKHHGRDGWQITARDRVLTELELLTAVEAGEIWHEFDHDHVILENDEGQFEIDDEFTKVHHLASCRGGSRYKLTSEGQERLAELKAQAAR